MKDEVPVAIFTGYAEAEADRIVGDYLVYEEGNCCKVRISREADGTYSGKVFWVENMLDPKTGEVLTDVKNPDKSLRDVPIDRIVLFSGMKYNAAKGIWDSAQIYHPVFGIKANATARFDTEGNLLIRGSVLGIGKTVSWKKLESHRGSQESCRSSRKSSCSTSSAPLRSCPQRASMRSRTCL